MVVNEETLQQDQQPGPSGKCNNLVESPNDESSHEKDDSTTFNIICKIPKIELTRKYENWIQCDICDDASA